MVRVSPFCLFHSEQDATFFFNYIKNQYPNIHFTMERETDHVLPFLDVLINNGDPHLSVTTVYRKKTFTGLVTSYLSFCPFTYKLGLIKILIDRTFKPKETPKFYFKMSFICMRMKNHFQINSIALSLTLKPRLETIPKMAYCASPTSFPGSSLFLAREKRSVRFSLR